MTSALLCATTALWAADPVAGFGTALEFDGTNDFVQIQDEGAFDFTTSMTVESWFKVDRFTISWQALVTKGDSSWRLHRYSDSGQIAFSTTSLGNGGDLVSLSRVDDGQWHHVAAVYDGTNKFLYLDGVLESTAPADAVSTNDSPVLLGGNIDVVERAFDGQMDEVRIWDTALPANTMTNWMYREVDSGHPAHSNLVAYYKLNDGSGAVALDDTGFYNGALSNMTDAAWASSSAGLEWNWVIVTTNDISFDGWLVGSDEDGSSSNGFDWALEFEIVSQPSNGTVVVSTNNAFTYTVDPPVISDQFTYRVRDAGELVSNISTVQVSVVYPLPVVTITNDLLTVSQTVETVTLEGTNNLWAVGTMTWTNLLNSTGGTNAVPGEPYAWQVPDVPLSIGRNMISVSVTNATGGVASNSVIIIRDPEHLGNSSIHYVSTNGAAIWPYTSWQDAARVIQDAVDAASTNDTVMVTHGVYDVGGDGENRVKIERPCTLLSVGGSEQTIISGNSSVRCLYLAAPCSVSGFTLTNGLATGSADGGGILLGAGSTVSNCVIVGSYANGTNRGGGAFLQSGGTLISCTLSNNNAYSGGGAFCLSGGTLTNCLVSSNTAYDGGGVVCSNSGSALTDCTLVDNVAQYGGGLSFYSGGILNRCMLSGNTAWSDGGGAYFVSGGTLNNSLLVDNFAGVAGGGAHCSDGGELNNCTLADNSTGASFSGSGGVLNNCIVYSNTGYDVGSGGTVRYTCASTGVVHGVDGCITNNPQFVDAAGSNYHLQVSSPCIGAGSNAYVQGGTDLDGAPRILAVTVDMGAYEMQLPPSLSTIPVSGIGTNSAQSGGEVLSEGTAPVPVRGCVWNTAGSPTLADSSTFDGAGPGLFASSLTGLVSQTTYFVRAYATNSYGVGYGDERVFTTGTMGAPGNCLDFDGVGDYVSCGTALTITGSVARTVEAWAYARSFNNGGIFQAGSMGETLRDFSLRTYSLTNIWRLQFWDVDVDLILADSLDAWHHYALTYDGASVQFYYDGVLITNQVIALDTGPADFVVGRWRDDLFDGQIDELRVWDHARTEVDIIENMRHELNGDEAGLLAYYPFNQQSTTALDDVTTNDYSGTLAGDPTWGASTIPWSYILTATAGEHGTIFPSGDIEMLPGGTTNFVVTPDAYFHVADVTTNGVSAGAVVGFTWSNVTASGTIHADFAADLAAEGTPYWWLAGYGWTNNFDVAETNNPDGDPFITGDEYIADTNPIDSNDWFRVVSISNSTVFFQSSENRQYTLWWKTNLVDGVWTPLESRLGAGGADSMSGTNEIPVEFYRLDVEIP